jgi:hemolysin III
MGQRTDLVPILRGVSHFWAFWCALAATIPLVALAPSGAARGAALVYGTGMCVLFAGSALFHRLRCGPRLRSLLCRIDHSAIFVFIAASYTPVALLVLDGPTGWTLLAAAWAGALAGVALSLAWIGAPRVLFAGTYVALGWIALLALPQLVARLPVAPLALMGAGGLLYTIGAVVYATRRPDPWPRVFGFHEVFHALVIAAAAMHFVAMAGWIIPAG